MNNIPRWRQLTRNTADEAEQEKIFGQLRHIQIERNYAPGWVWLAYREYTETRAPRNFGDHIEPRQPSVELLRWVELRHHGFVRSKLRKRSREKRRARAAQMETAL
jgi:hypothetical protein